MHEIFHYTVRIVIPSSTTVEKVGFNTFFVILRFGDWDAMNPGIWDWQKLSGFLDSGSRDCKC